MCKWEDKPIGEEKKIIPAKVFEAICNIIFQSAGKGKTIKYGEITNIINKQFPDVKIDNYPDMGHILGEINDQVAEATKTSKENPTSIYPSSIVINKERKEPGDGFWGVSSGDNPPSKVKKNERDDVLKEYQRNVFDTNKWNCNC